MRRIGLSRGSCQRPALRFCRWPRCPRRTPRESWQWATQQTCPPFYSEYDAESGEWSGCTYQGFVAVSVSGAWWETIYVNPYTGATSTQYSDTARAELTKNGDTLDPTYDRDAAAYHPDPPPCEYNCDDRGS